MTPPPLWATRSARRVDLNGFVSRFGELRAGHVEVFFKVETWQTYQEPGD